MKMIKELYTFANIKGKTVSLSVMVILLSILYCSLYTMVISVAVRLDFLFYYVFLYVFVLLTAYVYMIVLFQFVRNKREDKGALQMKSYMLPLFGVQTIYYVCMAGSSYLSISIFVYGNKTIVSYLLAIFMGLALIFYVPLQIFSCFYIYDGLHNPLKIVKQAFLKIVRHYQSCFYSLFVLLCVSIVFALLLSVFFDYAPSAFALNSAIVEIITHNNPFMNAMEIGLNVTKNLHFIGPFIISIVYGFVMSVLLVYYYSFMVCAYDENIKV